MVENSGGDIAILMSIILQPPASWHTLCQGLLKTVNTLEKGACKLLGDGRNTSVWFDPWIQNKEGFKVDLLVDGMTLT